MDGGQHAEALAADQKRSRFLENQGYRVLRFWDHEVLTHTDAVLERILGVTLTRTLTLALSLEGSRRARVKKAVR